MFPRKKQGLTIGVGDGNIARITAEGIDLVGRTAKARFGATYRWDEIAGVRIERVKARVAERALAVFERLPIHEDLGDTDLSLFGYVVITLDLVAEPDAPVSLRVPMRVRWRPTAEWVAVLQEDVDRALRDPAGREKFG